MDRDGRCRIIFYLSRVGSAGQRDVPEMRGARGTRGGLPRWLGGWIFRKGDSLIDPLS
jgi:hypothetical protein